MIDIRLAKPHIIKSEAFATPLLGLDVGLRLLRRLFRFPGLPNRLPPFRQFADNLNESRTIQALESGDITMITVNRLSGISRKGSRASSYYRPTRRCGQSFVKACDLDVSTNIAKAKKGEDKFFMDA